MGKFTSKFSQMVTKSNGVATDENFKEKKLRINRETVLPRVELNEFIDSNVQTVEYEHVPEIYFGVKQNPLSILPNTGTEIDFYAEHSVRAPEMILERLQNQYWFPQDGYLISRDGVVWRHSILGQYADPNFLNTYAVEVRNPNRHEEEYIFWSHLLIDSPEISGMNMILTHYASHNYGHFLLDMVPLIDFAANHTFNIVVKPLTEWQREFFDLYDINESRILECPDRCYKLKDCIVSNRHNAVSTYCASPQHRLIYEGLLKRIKSKFPKLEHKEHPKRLFLSRGSSKSRVLENREETEKLLESYGFTTIQPEAFSIPEQITMFNKADVIVSEFGAVMANVAFCKKDTTIIEIIPSGQNDPWSVHLCSALELKYISLFQEVKQENRKSISIGGKIIDNIYYSYECNINQLKHILQRLM